MGMLRLRAVLWKWLWFILAGTALVTLSTLAVSLMSAPIYRAAASVMVEQTLPDPGGVLALGLAVSLSLLGLCLATSPTIVVGYVVAWHCYLRRGDAQARS